MLTTLAVSNYRTLRDLVMPLRRLNLITGANGAGKSNVYRALRLLADSARGEVIPSLAREGGLPSTLWAGPEDISRAMRSGAQPIEGSVRRQSVNCAWASPGRISVIASTSACRSQARASSVSTR